MSCVVFTSIIIIVGLGINFTNLYMFKLVGMMTLYRSVFVCYSDRLLDRSTF